MLSNTALDTVITVNVAALRIHNERGLGRGFWFAALRHKAQLVHGINFETNLIFRGCQLLTNFMFGALIRSAAMEFQAKAEEKGFSPEKEV